MWNRSMNTESESENEHFVQVWTGFPRSFRVDQCLDLNLLPPRKLLPISGVKWLLRNVFLKWLILILLLVLHHLQFLKKLKRALEQNCSARFDCFIFFFISYFTKYSPLNLFSLHSCYDLNKKKLFKQVFATTRIWAVRWRNVCHLSPIQVCWPRCLTVPHLFK